MFDPSKVSSPTITNHGGSCCGISHIYSFPSIGRRHQIANADQAEQRVRFLISKYWQGSGRTLDEKKNRLYEAVLQNSQRRQWEKVLLKIGFECVSEFTNTNSGNRVYVYHYLMGPDNKHGPYKFTTPKVAKGAVPNPFAPRPSIDIPY